MKLRNLGISVSALVLVWGTALADIAGSEHDFSGAGWSGGEICIACHTTHNTDTTVANAPLWNHAVTNATFTVYSSVTLDATPGQPDGSSKLCLSCHDGTVALDSFGGATGNIFLQGDAVVGTDLSDDHPVSFVYDTALATSDGGLADPATVTAVSDLLYGGKVQCSSCHEVHNESNQNSLLVMSNAGSALCLTCHTK